MTKYASETTVSPEKSRNEIEKILLRYGADQAGSCSNRVPGQRQKHSVRAADA